MHSSKEEIRRRIAKRKKERNRKARNPKPGKPINWLADEEKYGFNDLVIYETGPEGEHPLFRKEVFFFKLLGSACLFLIIAILFKSGSPAVQPAKNFIEQGMSKDFQFAVVSDWYETKFGKPLALLPSLKKEGPAPGAQTNFAVPASGKILENFAKNGQGIMIETGKSAPVEAVNEGIVTFAGVKEGLGKTVVIQHGDKTESWYGNLDSIEVALYEYIEKAKEIGIVGPGSDEMKGEFYFAIKKGDGFIDPIQVIQFE